MIALEMAMQDAEGVRIARQIGAARVELTQALALGGLTPSPATLERAVEEAGESGPEIHVLIRCRAGGFCYDRDELETMRRDVRAAVSRGAKGVVIGALDAEGRLDADALAGLRDAAEGASVTLHRAIDVTPDPVAALPTARALGLRRVLTSGGASAAIDGIDTLRALVAAADGIEIMAGGGVTAANAALLAATGIDAVHFSAKRTVSAAPHGVRMGSAADGADGHEVTDPDEAAAIRDALAGVSSSAVVDRVV